MQHTPVFVALGKDCHITLSHPDINGGQPYGFILETTRAKPEPAIAITQEIFGNFTTICIYFNALLADNLLNPDGSQHIASRSEMYYFLGQFLSKSTDLTLSTPVGTIASVGATGRAATESHYPAHSVILCQLSNSGSYFAPANYEAFNNSVWDGPLFWDASYWR